MKMADPALMNQWMGMMTNPKMIEAMMKMMDPKMMSSMMNMSPQMMQGMTPGTADTKKNN